MTDSSIVLRAFAERDLWLFDRFANDPSLSEPFSWTGFRSAEGFRRRWEADGFLGESPYFLAVSVGDADVVGWVTWRENPRPGPGVWEIGVLIVPEFRRRGAATQAQRLLVDYLFATTTAHRIWAGTEVHNVGEQTALERSGFRREGVLRGAHFRDGEWRDSVIFGVVRSDIAEG